MGAAITTAGGARLKLSNGGFSVLHEVLALAGSRLATCDWQRYWVLWIACHGLDLYGHNVSSYQLEEMPWEVAAVDEEIEFLLQVIDGARARLGWETLAYRPATADESLATLREMVQSCAPPDVLAGDPFRPEVPDTYETCAVHGVILHAAGCLIL